MRIIIYILLVILLFGCSPYKQLVKELENINYSFDSLEIHRGGNVTSSTVNIYGVKKDGGVLIVNRATITADYGPFFNFNATICGYRRQIMLTK